jgi:drug/metabolite transporter (DMT)-like permease
MTARSALAALHVAVALFGFAALFGKWLSLPATEIVLGRTIVAAATLAIIVKVRGERIGRPNAALALNGAILALHWVSFFAAVQVSTVAIGLLGYASFPLFVLALERRDAARRSRHIEAVTAGLAAAGLVVLMPGFAMSDDVLRGLALGLVSGFTFALLSVRSHSMVRQITPTRIALWQNGFAAACLAPVALLVDALEAPTAVAAGLLLILGVVCTALAHTLFIASMRRVAAHTASVVAALEPVYGIALAIPLLGEIPSARTLAGGTLIVAAAVIASRRPA